MNDQERRMAEREMLDLIESKRFVRGLVNGVLLSIPLWGLILWAVGVLEW